MTKIEWATDSWNPITGCTPISEGCVNCYARRMAYRLKGRFGYPADDPFKVTFHPDKLDQPFRWRKPRRIFVCSMGDLFHSDVETEWRDSVLRTIALSSRHTFMVLTKRPGQMLEYFHDLSTVDGATRFEYPDNVFAARYHGAALRFRRGESLGNLWPGLTVCNQQEADKKLPEFLQVPGKKFLSIEPMLGPINFFFPVDKHCTPALKKIDCVILGGESGPGARPMKLEWAESIVAQCQSAEVPVFVKQLHINGKLSKNMDEWPEDLRVRELPWK